VTDGNKEADGQSFLELSPGLQWVQIDLGSPRTIHAILVWHYHSEARVYRDVVVQVAEDPDLIAGLQTVFNNDHDNSAGLGVGPDKEYVETFEGRLMPVPGRRARFVRLYSWGNTTDDMNHLVEVEVHGTPAP
jgi:gentisate 1,2-dioxygenase